MVENYMVVSFNAKGSVLKRVVSGKKKDTGEEFGFIDDKSFMRLEGESISLGTLVAFEKKRVEVGSNSNKFAAAAAKV